MNGKTVLLDSNICIYLSKEALVATDILHPDDFVAISIITYMETLGHKFEGAKEEQYLKGFYKTISILPVTDNIATLVIGYKKLRKLKLPDAIILATARENNCKLVTRNANDFINLDPQVEIINPFDK